MWFEAVSFGANSNAGVGAVCMTEVQTAIGRTKYWHRRENCVNRQYHHQLPSFFPKKTDELATMLLMVPEPRKTPATQNTVENYVSGY